LVNPYNNIYFDYAKNIIGTQNENISLTTGQRMLIYALGTGGTTIINNNGGGGGGITYITINLNKLELMNDFWFTNQENVIFAYTYNWENKLIDVDSVEFSGNPLKERLSEGIYRATYKVKEISEINITVTANDKSKIITESKLIKINEPTLENKFKGTITGFVTKTGRLFQDSTVITVGILFLGILFSATIVILFLKRKGNNTRL